MILRKFSYLIFLFCGCCNKAGAVLIRALHLSVATVIFGFALEGRVLEDEVFLEQNMLADSGDIVCVFGGLLPCRNDGKLLILHVKFLREWRNW